MNGHAPAERIRRILIALDASAGSLAALESVATLAARLEAELVGLFVEDVNLLRLAALPFARELSAVFARRRPLATTDMERALRAQAALAEQAMARVAARLRVPWSFRTARGQVAAELLAAAREADLIALGMAGLALGRGMRLGPTVRAFLTGAPRPVLLIGPGVAVRPPIVALYKGSASCARALEIAARLARLEGERLAVVLLAASDDEAQRQRSEAAARLAPLGVEAEFRMVVRGDARSLERIVRAEGAGTLVLGDGSVHGEEELQDLLCRLGCPALLVS